MAAARSVGLPDLKIPEPTKTPSAPSCIIMAASAGRDAAGCEQYDGQLAQPGDLGNQLVRCLQLLGSDEQLIRCHGGERAISARI